MQSKSTPSMISRDTDFYVFRRGAERDVRDVAVHARARKMNGFRNQATNSKSLNTNTHKMAIRTLVTTSGDDNENTRMVFHKIPGQHMRTRLEKGHWSYLIKLHCIPSFKLQYQSS